MHPIAELPMSTPVLDIDSPDEKAYRRRLLAFLGVATFFEGFEQMALAQLLPALRADFGIDEFATGLLVSFASLGTLLAYFLVRHADTVGRKPVLNITIIGYTACSLLSGLAPNIYLFGLAQLFAKVFLIGEWAVSSVIAAEEFPAQERGKALGLINGLAGLGAVVCAGVIPLFLKSPWGWRSVFFFGFFPLVLLMVARRGMRETRRFSHLPKAEKVATPLLRIWSTPYWKRMVMMASIWFFAYLCTNTSVTFFKPYAVETLGLSEERVGLIITVAALVSMPVVLAIGYVLDLIGRKVGATLILAAVTIGCVGIYHSSSTWALMLFTTLALFGNAALIPAFNAFNTELFPTHLRSDAFAWSNNLLGRISYIIAPSLVGFGAVTYGWGPSVALTAFGPVLAMVLLAVFLPETRGRELEETSRLH